MPPLACLFCFRPARASRQASCPAFALGGVAAPAGCCGGCTSEAQPELAVVDVTPTGPVGVVA
jgi:hypothetical protein